MENLWKKSAGVLLLGSVLALAGCDLGDENGSTASAGSTSPPTTPLAYSGRTDQASLDTDNQDTAGEAAATTVGGLINNAANGGLDNIVGPIGVVADSGAHASNATLVSLFSSLKLDGLNQPAAVASQPFPIDASVRCSSPSPDSAVTYYLSGIYIVVKFDGACLAVLSGASPNNEATVNGEVVVTVSGDTNHYTFTPSNLTVEDNTAGVTYVVPDGTYMLDNGQLSVLTHCHGDDQKTCKITAPTDLSSASPWSFADATVYDPTLGSFNVEGSGLVLCAEGDGGTPDSPFSIGSLTLTTVPASLTVTVTFSNCGEAPIVSSP